VVLGDALKLYRVQCAVVLALLVLLYADIFPEMVKAWHHDENYSHGFVVPFIAGYFIYESRQEVLSAEIASWWGGAIVIVAGLTLLVFGKLSTEYFTMRASLIVILAGIVLFLFGSQVFRSVNLSIAYLIFMVPIPYIIYDMVAFPLKLFVTRISVGVLKLIGVVVISEGNVIMFPATTLEVADACSGIRSLLSLLALAVAYAVFLKISNFRRWLIILAAVPIAIVTNALRVIVTGILAQVWGARAAEGFFHEFAGLMVFLMAIVLLVFVGVVLGAHRSHRHNQA
jgi:exosortase